MKRHFKIATLRRLVALTMLSALLFSNTAVYADTVREGEPSQEVVVSETGNSDSLSSTSSSNSSSNLNDTVSGRDITEDNNSNTTTEENTDSFERTVSLELSNDDSVDSSDKAALLGESKVNEPKQEKSEEEKKKEEEEKKKAEEERKAHEWDCFMGRHVMEKQKDLHAFQWRDGVHYHEEYYKCKYCTHLEYDTDTREECTFDGDFTYDPSFAGEYVKGKYVHTESRTCKVCGIEKETRKVDCHEGTDSEWVFDAEASKKNTTDKHHIEANNCATCGQILRRSVECNWTEWTIDESYRNWFKRNEHKEVRECKDCHEQDVQYVTCCWNDEDWEYDTSSQGKNKDGKHQMIRTCRNEGCGNTQTKLVDCTEFTDWHYAHRDGTSFFGKQHYKAHECLVCQQVIEKRVDCKWKHLFANLEYCPDCFNIHDSRDVIPYVEYTITNKDGSVLKPTDKIVEDKISHDIYDSTVKVTATVKCEAFNNSKDETFWNENMDVELYLNTPDSKQVKMSLVPGSVDAKGSAKFEYVVNQPVEKSLSIAGITADYKFCEDYVANIKADGANEPEEAKEGHKQERKGSYKKEILAIVRNAEPEKHIENYSSTVTAGDWAQPQDENAQPVWYSRNVRGEDITVLVKATTGKPLEKNYVSKKIVLSDKAASSKGIKFVDSVSRPVISEGNWNDKFNGDITLEYENDVTYIIAGDADSIEDGKHEYKLSGSNIEEAIVVYVDNTVPTVKFDYDGEFHKINTEFSKKNVTVTATVTEEHPCTKNDVITNHTLKLKDAAFNFKVGENGTHVSSITTSKDDEYIVSGTFTDLAGNTVNVEGQKDVKKFIVDTEAPELTITFNDSESPAENGKYYKADRIATLQLKDLHLYASGADINSQLTISAEGGTPKVTNFSGKDTEYTGSILFHEDGIYSLPDIKEIMFEDKAGNKVVLSNGHSDNYKKEFVVDQTVPTISVKFDNNNSLNGNYFKAARQAEIVFTEKNFSDKGVTYERVNGDLSVLPAIQHHKNNNPKNTKNTALIDFNTDGRYGFILVCKDLAGNISEKYVSDEFIIDMTLPELEISGVVDMSANNGKVAPIVVSKDTNLTDACTEISLVGSNRGKVTPSISKTNGAETFTYTFADMAHEKANDDLYTLSVKLTDLAGNSVEKSVKYSLNRFGSIFVLSDATKAMVDGYYVTKPQDVVITEINVDSLTKKEVSVAFDGSVKELREGASFTTNDQTNSNGWHSISYNVGKANFNKDGIYSVTVFSEDRASNKQSSQSKDAEVEFLLDKTAPSVIVSGLEDGGIYEEESHDFSVNAADTIGVTSMKVYLNDEKLASFTADELNQNGGTAVLTIPTKDDYQKVTIQCTDVAGNVTNLAYNNLLVSVKAEELLLEDNLTPTAKLDAGIPAVAAALGSPKTLTVGIILILAALAIVGATVYKKKKH